MADENPTPDEPKDLPPERSDMPAHDPSASPAPPELKLVPRPESAAAPDAIPPAKAPAPASRNEPLPLAPVTWTIAALNILVFVAMFVSAGSEVMIAPSIDTLLKWGANHGPLTGNGEYWRLFTCMFLHIGILHIVMNMWALLSFGPLVEQSFGRVRYAVLYLLAGLGGSCVSMLWNPMLVSAGASGAIFGLFGAMLALTHVYKNPERKEEMARRQKSILTLIVYNIGFGMIKSNIDNGAHLGGLAIGLLSGLALAPESTPNPFVQPGLSVRTLGGTAAVTALVVGLACAIPLRIHSNPSAQYNDYVHQLQPLLKAQDALLEELQSAAKKSPNMTDADYLKLVKKWRATADTQLKDFEAIKLPNEEIEPIHKNMIDRAKEFAVAFKDLEAYGTSQKDSDLEEYKQDMKEMGKSLDDFLEAKNAYFTKYGLTAK